MKFARQKGIILFFASTIIAVFALSISAAVAEWNPKKTIHLISTNKAGSYYDAQARIIAKELNTILNQTVIVENVYGAGMMMGTIKAYRARPDGYTIAFTSSAAIILNQMFNDAKYDYTKFTYLGQTLNSARVPSALVTTGGKGLDKFEDILKLDRPFRWATPGQGSIGDIGPKAISHYFGLKNPVYIPYGGPDLVPAVVRGECDGGSFPDFMVVPHLDTNELKLVLAVGRNKFKDFPEVPDLNYVGHPEIADLLVNYHVVFAPPSLPKDVYDVLSEAVYWAVLSKSLKDYHKKAVSKGQFYLPAPCDITSKNVMAQGKALQAAADFLK